MQYKRDVMTKFFAGAALACLLAGCGPLHTPPLSAQKDCKNVSAPTGSHIVNCDQTATSLVNTPGAALGASRTDKYGSPGGK